MIAPVLQFDDFASDARAVRDAVISGPFETVTGPDGAKYTGISRYEVPQWFSRIGELIGCPIIPRLAGFRLNLEGELPHSWVHSDDICAKYATVLYLNPAEQCSGGTAFWKHKQTGMTRLPSDTEIQSSGCVPLNFHRWMTAEWKNLSAWEQYAMVPMQFNRFITYPTCFFHSRFPFEAFGKGPEDGRLVWVCFYDKAGEA